jgi:hypothetical protein
MFSFASKQRQLTAKQPLTQEELESLGDLMARALQSEQLDVIVNDHVLAVSWGIGLLRSSHTCGKQTMVLDLVCKQAQRVKCGLAKSAIALRRVSDTDPSKRN